MSIGRETFGITKTDFNEKIGKIIKNFRANSKLIGEPKSFVLRCCKLTDQWGKMASDPEVMVYLRNIDIAGGRKVKMISLERGATRQPVPKQKLVDALYPPKKTATTATPEEKHYNAVKAAMRGAVTGQLKNFRDGITLPVICYLSGMKIRLGMKTDVDHVGKTFSEICDCFLAEREICYTDITLIGPPTAKRFKDISLWQEWQDYHECHARYALALASANRSKGSDGYATPLELYGSFKTVDPDDISLDF